MDQVTPKHIDKIMIHYGESLPDLGAEYTQQFLEWYSQKEPANYQSWLKEAFRGKAVDPEVLAEELLCSFSGSLLGGRVEKTHDTLLAEFCNQNAEAKQHIEDLLEDMK